MRGSPQISTARGFQGVAPQISTARGFQGVAPQISTARLTLRPLGVADATEMAVVLGDERLHEFIGGRPDSPGQLADRYRRLVAGSGRTGELWLNWIVALATGAAQGEAVGTVQATVTSGPTGPTAAIAWVIGVPWQGKGYASEAAIALVSWLGAWRPVTIIACIHPAHVASQRVAERAGLSPTDREIDGEQVWELVLPAPTGRQY